MKDHEEVFPSSRSPDENDFLIQRIASKVRAAESGAIRIQSYTSASVKSYQLVKVVSGGRAPGKKFKFGITTTFSN